jgi:hypothetical protein
LCSVWIGSPGREEGLALAVRLAGSLDVPLVLVHGIEPAGRVGEEVGEAGRRSRELEATVTRRGGAAEAAGVRAIVEVVEDRPAPALVAVATSTTPR